MLSSAPGIGRRGHASNPHRLSSVILILSDIHFGKRSREGERSKEQDLLEMIDHFKTHLRDLFLLGDVFDQYIEHRFVAPKGHFHFLSMMARLTEAGVGVTYLVGNHDPWHLDYFESELGVRVARAPIRETFHGHSTFLAHGDELGRTWAVSAAQRITRHPVAMALYRLLPADVGFRLARWVKKRLDEPVPDQATAAHLRRQAAEIAAGGHDLVVLGHSHIPEDVSFERGRYINTGSWDLDRTFARIDDSGVRLEIWNGGTVSGYFPRTR